MNPKGLLSKADAIVLGGSAGAVEALLVLVRALPGGCPAAVLVVVHLPGDRPSLLLEIFAPVCRLPVREGEDKEPIERGTLYLAPAGYHMLVDEGPRIALSVDETVLCSRPSIDVLFESAADIYGEKLCGVILTGANEDGPAACGPCAAREALHRAGSRDRAGAAHAAGRAFAGTCGRRPAGRPDRGAVRVACAAGRLLMTLVTGGTGRTMQRVKCLLVDDLEENLLALSSLLRRADVELFEARSAREALELLLVHDMALAILDVQMPGMDGFELAELMRGSERMTRLIEDMLDLSLARLAGGIPLKKEHADPGLLVQRIVQEAQAAAPDRRIEVLQEGTLAGEWDADRLSQAASNLIGNALQHGKDGMAVEVRLDGTRDDMVSRRCPMRERSRPTSCRTSSIRSGTRRARTRTAKGSGWASTSSSRS